MKNTKPSKLKLSKETIATLRVHTDLKAGPLTSAVNVCHTGVVGTAGGGACGGHAIE